MQKQILHPKVYYYTNAIDDFDFFMQTLNEISSHKSMDSSDSEVWQKWTASNDVDFIYGQTMSFSQNFIDYSENSIEQKKQYIYDTVMKTFDRICRDYAKEMGDYDEPRLFPTFNIKKYSTGVGMGAHFDQLDGDKTLRYSLVMYLNDDYEGGEISFQLKDYDGGWTSTDGWVHGAPAVDLDYSIAAKNKSIDFGVKPEANSLIIFPASAPYFHTAHIVKSGNKYMIPGHWIHNNMDLHRSM